MCDSLCFWYCAFVYETVNQLNMWILHLAFLLSAECNQVFSERASGLPQTSRRKGEFTLIDTTRFNPQSQAFCKVSQSYCSLTHHTVYGSVFSYEILFWSFWDNVKRVAKIFYMFQVFSTSTGLTKTVYNPAALKAGHKGVAFVHSVSSEDALKRKQVSVDKICWWMQLIYWLFFTQHYFMFNLHIGGVFHLFFFSTFVFWFMQQEALKLQQDVRKKKQEILEQHIQTQKVCYEMTFFMH